MKLTPRPQIVISSPPHGHNTRVFRLNVVLTDGTYYWSRSSKPTDDIRIRPPADILATFSGIGSFIISGDTINISKWGDYTWEVLDRDILNAIHDHMGWRRTPKLAWLRRIIDGTKSALRFLRDKWLELTVAPVDIVYEQPEVFNMTRRRQVS